MLRRRFLSIFSSVETKPLENWTKQVRNGHIKRVRDGDVHALVLEIFGTNINTTFIRCPEEAEVTLNVQLPCLVLIMKNLKRYNAFEVQVLDEQRMRRRFRATTLEASVQARRPFLCTLPLRLDEGWNRVQLDLSDFTRRIYGTEFVECLRVQIHANCRLRQVYFTDRIQLEEGDSFDECFSREQPYDPKCRVPKPDPAGPQHNASSITGSLPRNQSVDIQAYVAQ